MDNNAMVMERVQELAWALVDEEISDDEMTLLDSLLLSDDNARRRYLDCVGLHADLMMHFASPAAAASPAGVAKSPVLGFLNSGNPPIGYDLPPAEDLK